MESWHDAIVTASQRQKYVTDPGIHIGPDAGPSGGRLRMTVGHERSKPQKGCRWDVRCQRFPTTTVHATTQFNATLIFVCYFVV
jgi:hypothetical protein